MDVLEFWKIIAGVVALIVGQAILRFVLEPIKDFHKERADTSYLLLFHQAKITNASATNPKVPDDLKEMAAALISTMGQIPFYRFLALIRVFGLPSKESVREAARELNGIAYSTGPSERHGDNAVSNLKALETIARLLKIQTGYS